MCFDLWIFAPYLYTSNTMGMNHLKKSTVDIICKYISSYSANFSSRLLAYPSKVLFPFPCGQVGSSRKFFTYLGTTVFLMTVQLFCMVWQDCVWGKNAGCKYQHLKLPENKIQIFQGTFWMTDLYPILPPKTQRPIAFQLTYLKKMRTMSYGNVLKSTCMLVT